MPHFLTTKEVADLLRIKERKVYDLAAAGDIPCTRATGKLLFDESALRRWLAGHSADPARSQRPPVILGSHDPLLEWALRQSRCGLASMFDSSLDGLSRFAAGEGIAAGIHIHDADSGSWNQRAVETALVGHGAVVVRWATRQRGLIIAEEEQRIANLSDLVGRNVTPRQPEAGTQMLLDHLLAVENIDMASIRWCEPARSEADAAIAVQTGKADATFGLAAVAAQYRLGFAPLIDEHYDLVVDRHAWFEPAFQRLLAFCKSNAFAERARDLAGYDMGKHLDVVLNLPN